MLIVPDVRPLLAAHSAATGGWPGANVKMGGLYLASGLGCQTLARPLGHPAKRLWPNIHLAAAQALKSTTVQGSRSWPKRHQRPELAAPGLPKVGPGSNGLGQTNPATRPGRARGRHHLEW